MRRHAPNKLFRQTPYVLIILLLLVCVILYIAMRRFERAVVFHPEKYPAGGDWRLPLGAEDAWFQTADGIRLHGWLVNSRTKPATATVIYFHGNGGNISNVGWIGEQFAARGFDCLLVDYRGYGKSDGRVTDERGVYRDADAAYDFLVKECGVNPTRLVLYGQSLGTTAAVDLAARKKCGALILESGLSSAADMTANILPWLPRWLYVLGQNRFESARKLSQVHCPVLITHGEPDLTIPTAQGRTLYAAANEPKRLLIFPGAGHNVAGTLGEDYIEKLAEFIRGEVKEQ